MSLMFGLRFDCRNPAMAGTTMGQRYTAMIGIVLMAFGIAFLALRSLAGDHANADVFIGSLALALGVGSEIAAAATFFLSRSFGLLKRDGE